MYVCVEISQFPTLEIHHNAEKYRHIQKMQDLVQQE